MMDTVLQLGPWGWFVLGGILLVAEIVTPGASLVWLGVAAFVTGGLGLLAPFSWQTQILVFAALSLLAVLLGRWLVRAPEKASDRPFLNRRADAMVGRSFFLETPIQEGAGAVRVDDSLWRVDGPDLPAGAQVKVVRVDGPTLIVEPN